MKKIILMLFTVNCSFLITYSQWQPDVRLTNDPAGSFTSANNAWCIASTGNFVHVVWTDARNGDSEIYYKRSTDGGIIWGADTRITNSPELSIDPSISISGTHVHIVWDDSRDGNTEIYYKRSTDNGITWGADTRLTNNPDQSFNPSLSVSGLMAHVVWYDDRDANNEVYCKRSTDGGMTWGTDTRLTNNSAASENVSVFLSGTNVNIVWEDARDGNQEIYYKLSVNNGISFGADTRLTIDSAESYAPSITGFGQAVHVVWRDNRDGNSEIYYKHSTNAGISWGIDTRLTNNAGDSKYPSISVSGSFVHIVWQDERDGNNETYYKRSTDGGITWEADTRLTNNSADSQFPSVTVYNQAVQLVWYDTRDGNSEIYYKRNPLGNPVGIQIISSEIPGVFSLEQNYPNPFNPVTKIKFDIAKETNAKLTIYDITGRIVETIFDENVKAGKYEVSFDASKYSSGVYFYRIAIHSDKLQTNEFTETKKMLLVK